MAIVDWVKHALPMKLKDGKRHVFPTLASMVYLKDGTTPITDGNGNWNADKALDADKLGGKEPEYYASSEELTHLNEIIGAENLLINSNFSNGRFIAQAGLNGLHGSTVYLGDCWLGDPRITAEQKQNHIALTSAAQFAYIMQKVHVDGGKTYTIAIKSTGADCYLAFDIEGAKERHHEGDIYTLQINVPSDSNLIKISIYPAFKEGGGSCDIYWAALYEGEYVPETLPPYVPTHPRLENLKIGNPVQPVNLFDNSNFVDPVMQAGFNGMHGSETYVIDRWRHMYPQFGIIEKIPNGISVTGNDCYVAQKVNKNWSGETMTFAAKVDGVVMCGHAHVVSGQVAEFAHKTGVRLFKLVEDWFCIRTVDDTQHTIEWAALYEGSYTAETLPPYMPKGYAAELLACEVAEKGNVFAQLSEQIAKKCQILSKTMTGTTSANGNFILNFNTWDKFVPVAAFVTTHNDVIAIPERWNASNWGLHICSSTSDMAALASTEVTLKLFYIEVPQ